MKQLLEMKPGKNSVTQKDSSLKVMIVGEGGQGIQTVAKILTSASFTHNYHTSYLPNFGTEQRGGISIAFVQISTQHIITPKFKVADIFLIVSNRNIERTLGYVGTQTHVLCDVSLLTPATVEKLKKRSRSVFPIDAFQHAITRFTERNYNVIILGILVGLIDPKLSSEVLSKMDTTFDKYYRKDSKLKALNHQSFELGLTLTQ